MRNLKKLLSVLVVAAMVFTLIVPAFAASGPAISEGIDDAKVKAAVEKLAAFGIINGKEDGKYHPEEEITRDAFIKMVVEALGMGTPAQAPTPFSDVPADRWSSGYINVAHGAGLVKGRPDGTFGPLDNVTLAEAVTILVRALGYQDSFLSGTWPSNYLAKASQEGITKGVSAGANTALTRGMVAVLIDNALDANVLVRNNYGDENTWRENDNETLLYNKLGIVKVEECDVIGTPKVDNLDEDEIKFETQKDYDNENPADQYEGEKTLEVVYPYVDINSLLGLNVNLYIDEDTDDILYVEPAKDYKVIYDVIDPGEEISEDSITLMKLDDEYEFAKGYVVYIDNEEVASDDKEDVDEIENKLDPEVGEDDVVYGKFVLNESGNIVLADLMKFDGDKAMIVTDVDEDAGEITYNTTSADDQKTITLDDYDRYVIYDTAGNVMELGDIQKDDILYLDDEDLKGDDLTEQTNSDEVAYLVVVRNTVEGVIESYDDEEVEIDGKTYDWTSHAVPTVSINDDEDYSTVETDTNDDLEDATDDEIEVVALLDLVGDVRHVRGSAEASSDDMYSIVTGVDIKYGDAYIKVVNQENDEVEYLVDADYEPDVDYNGTVGYTHPEDIKAGDLIKYTLNSDGDIDSIAFLGAVNDNGSGGFTVDTKDVRDANDATAKKKGEKIDAAVDKDLKVKTDVLTDDFGKESITVEGLTTAHDDDEDYVVADRVQCLDVTAAGTPSDYDWSDAEFVDYEKLVDKEGKDTSILFVIDDDEVVQFVAFLADFNAASDEQAGYAIKYTKKGSDPKLKIVLPGGEEVTYIVDNRNGVDLDDEMVVIFEEKQNGKIDVLNSSHLGSGKAYSEDYRTVTGVVYEINGRNIKIADKDGKIIGKTYKVASNCAIWKTDGDETFSKLKEGKTLVTIAVKDSIVEVIKIYDIDNGTDNNEAEAEKFFDAYERDNPTHTLRDFDDLYNDLTNIDKDKYGGEDEYNVKK